MASIHRHKTSKTYRIRFRFGGQRFFRSLKTKDRKVALVAKGRVEETLRLIEQGRLEIPADADPAVFILSDGKLAKKPSQTSTVSLKKLFDEYKKRLPEGAKEKSTTKTEQTHMNNFLRLLPASRSAKSFTTADLQRYVEKRLKEKRGTRKISPETVKREIDTFRAIWNWAKPEYVDGDSPAQGLVYSKRDQKPPFMTWDEIDTRIARGGLTEDEIADLWECLYLTMEEIVELLEHVRENPRYPFFYPMLVFVAYTGVRRSEMMRSLIDDFDLDGRTVLVREKKRSQEKAITFRRVDLAEPVVQAMRDWFSVHPGGQHTFCMPSASCEAPRGLTADQARDQFERTFKKTRWKKVRGYHVFRHSFASNLASRGVDQRIIDLWMGHQTEEMRERYRHLHPNTRKSAIDLLAE